MCIASAMEFDGNDVGRGELESLSLRERSFHFQKS